MAQLEELNVNTNLVKASTLAAILAKLPMNTSVFIAGPPGIGKTDICVQLAQHLGADLLIKLAATMDPTDLGGIPFVEESTKSSVFYPPKDLLALTESAFWLTDEQKAKPVVAVFDDITTAPEQVFAALFRLFQHREIAGHKIRSNVFLIGTGNRESDKAAARPMPTALNNRFLHFDLGVDVEAWKAWAIDNQIRPEIVGFISAHSYNLHKFDPASANRAFPTPRSIANLSRILDVVGIGDSNRMEIVSGMVGKGWAIEFDAFLTTTVHAVPPEEILKDPMKARVPPKAQIDVIHATISSLVYYVKQHDSEENVKKSMVYACQLPHRELAATLGHQLLKRIVHPKKDPKFMGNILNSKEGQKFSDAFGNLFAQLT